MLVGSYSVEVRIMRVRFSHCVIVLTFLLSACGTSTGDRAGSGASAPAAGTKLTADQIRKELVGRTAIGRTNNNEEYAFYIAPDGTFKYAGGSSSPSSSGGTYRITSDDQFCANYTALGREYCYFIYKDGETYRSVLDGKVATTYTVRPGNPENL